MSCRPARLAITCCGLKRYRPDQYRVLKSWNKRKKRAGMGGRERGREESRAREGEGEKERIRDILSKHEDGRRQAEEKSTTQLLLQTHESA